MFVTAFEWNTHTRAYNTATEERGGGGLKVKRQASKISDHSPLPDSPDPEERKKNMGGRGPCFGQALTAVPHPCPVTVKGS